MANVDDLVRRLEDSDGRVRRQAAYELGEAGPYAGATVVLALIKAPGDPLPGVRAEAAWAFGEIGSAAVAAVPALTEALWDADRDVRHFVVWALGSIGPAAVAAVPALAEATQDPEALVRFEAGGALKAIAGK